MNTGTHKNIGTQIYTDKYIYKYTHKYRYTNINTGTLPCSVIVDLRDETALCTFRRWLNVTEHLQMSQHKMYLRRVSQDTEWAMERTTRLHFRAVAHNFLFCAGIRRDCGCWIAKRVISHLALILKVQVVMFVCTQHYSFVLFLLKKEHILKYYINPYPANVEYMVSS